MPILAFWRFCIPYREGRIHVSGAHRRVVGIFDVKTNEEMCIALRYSNGRRYSFVQHVYVTFFVCSWSTYYGSWGFTDESISTSSETCRKSDEYSWLCAFVIIVTDQMMHPNGFREGYFQLIELTARISAEVCVYRREKFPWVKRITIFTLISDQSSLWSKY